MAWATPKTWTNTTLTTTDLNQHVRDNERELWHELSYTEFTSNVSVTATTEGTANTVVSSGAVTYDGNPVILKFECVSWFHDTSGGDLTLVLFDVSTALGILWAHGNATATSTDMGGVIATRRFTPSAGSHTYQVKAYTNAGTATVAAGAGGAGTRFPGTLQILGKGGA